MAGLSRAFIRGYQNEVSSSLEICKKCAVGPESQRLGESSVWTLSRTDFDGRQRRRFAQSTTRYSALHWVRASARWWLIF
jgi:hypothetical protein